MQFHNPKDMAAAIAIEAAELQEHFLWVDNAESSARARARLEGVKEEIADIAIFLLELADNLGIDLGDAVCHKLKVNDQKYPIGKARGRASKYSEL
jgi:NTP pyrophosphatase (non-canonical NTP hydrolase)